MECDQLLYVLRLALRRDRNVDHRARHFDHRHEILLRVVGQIGAQRRIDREMRGIGNEQRRAIGRRALDVFGGDDAGGAGAVVDHHRSTEVLGDRRRHQARDHVRRSARAERHHQAHRLALRERLGADQRQE